MPPCLTLVIARHGNTFESTDTPVMVGLKTDLPLTAQGHLQAKNIGQELSSRSIVALYSGHLARQTQTADGILEELHSKPQRSEHDCLNEIDYGPWEGLTPSQVQQQWPQEYALWNQGQWQDAIFQETHQHRIASIRQWFKELSERFTANETVVAVTSGGVLRMIHTLLEPNAKDIKKVSTGHYCIVLVKGNSFEKKAWNLKPGKPQTWLEKHSD